MRLLFVNPYYRPYLGGIERIIARLAAELRHKATVDRVGVLTTRVYYPDRIMTDWPSYEVIDDVDVFRCRFWPTSLPRVSHAALAGYLSSEIGSVLRKFKPDLVHFTYSEWWAANLLTYLCSRSARHVLSTFFHDVPRRRSTWPLYTTNRWLVRRMDAVHVLSATEKEQVRRAYGADPHQTVVIPPGLDNEPAPKREAKDAVAVLAVGRMNSHKGQLSLVRMVNRLLEDDHSLNIKLWLAGDDAGAGDSINEFVREKRLESVVQVFGHCNDEHLVWLYQQADIFALPTKYESFGIVFLEAMSRGLPVITYASGPVPSILRQGAVIIPTGNEDAFAAALRALVTNASDRLALGRQARQLAESFAGWKSTAEQFLALYQRILTT